MEAHGYDESQWSVLFRSCLRKDALDFFTTQKPKHKDWASFFESFKVFFDNRSTDNEYHWFATMLKQQDHEDYDKWFLRFEKNVQKLQLSKQIPAVDDPQFHSFYMKTFYSKLNKYCFAVIDKKLKDLSTCASNCSTNDFKRWIDDAKLTERNFLAFSRNNQPPRHGKKKNNFSNKHFDGKNQSNEQPTSNQGNQQKALHCYYCNEDGHYHRNKATKEWLCPEKLAGKPPCEQWVKFTEAKKKGKANVNAVMSDSSERREVALTRDISFKGKHNWFNNLLTFLDLGGCENVVNSNFAQHKLHLPIVEDDSAASKEVQ